MSYRITAAALAAAFMIGCGDGERKDEPDSFASDTVEPGNLDTPAAGERPNGEDSLSDRPADGADEASPPDEPATREPLVSDADPLSGRYALVSVQGESLPAAIGVGPECELFLGDGELRILDDGRFAIRTRTWENCNGERGNEQTHEAEGRMSRSADRIRFEATYDSLFGSASGEVRGREIHIDTFATEGGEQEVDWTFRR